MVDKELLEMSLKEMETICADVDNTLAKLYLLSENSKVSPNAAKLLVMDIHNLVRCRNHVYGARGLISARAGSLACEVEPIVAEVGWAAVMSTDKDSTVEP